MHLNFTPEALLKLLQDELFEIVFADEGIGKEQEGTDTHRECQQYNQTKPETGHSPSS
jgi:hypothetical protein